MGKKTMSKRGFTLIELMVIISIIGLLSTFAIIALNNSRAKGRDAKRLADAKQIQQALELYYDKYHYYPQVNAAYTSAAACGVNWCTLKTALNGILNLPNDPLGNNNNYRYYYDSDANDGYQSYGFMVRLETNNSIVSSDGGYYSNVSLGQYYEIGPQLRYCKKYAGASGNWWGAQATICVGGD